MVGPEQTLRRFLPIARSIGVTRVGGIGGLDRLGLPVVCAYRPTARSLAVSQGKGLTVAAATASAMMESLELWHAEQHRVPTRYASYAQLNGADTVVVDVEGLVRCPCSEYSADRPLRWTRALELSSDRETWVPYEAVHCDWRLPGAAGEHSFQNGSNGLASGNTIAEAVTHAVCEVIERDAIVRFDQVGEADSLARRVDPATIDDPDVDRLLDRFAACGIELVIWDMTSPVGVPTFSCVAVEVDSPWYQPLPQTQGSGTHPRRVVALQRAITEAAQARAAVIAGSRDDIFDDRYRHYYNQAERDVVAQEIAIPATRAFDATAEADHDDAEADLRWLLDRLAAAGRSEVAVVDLTDAEWEVPVVKVLIPGLEWRPWEE